MFRRQFIELLHQPNDFVPQFEVHQIHFRAGFVAGVQLHLDEYCRRGVEHRLAATDFEAFEVAELTDWSNRNQGLPGAVSWEKRLLVSWPASLPHPARVADQEFLDAACTRGGFVVFGSNSSRWASPFRSRSNRTPNPVHALVSVQTRSSSNWCKAAPRPTSKAMSSRAARTSRLVAWTVSIGPAFLLS